MPGVIVDISHNEQIRSFPNGLFGDEIIFDFINPGEKIGFDRISNYDVLYIGDIIPPKNGKDHLFLRDEILAIMKYVKCGGSLFLSVGAGGDFGYPASSYSIRALMPITSIKKYLWGELWVNKSGRYLDYKENLIVDSFPDHPIFSGVKKTIFSDCTLCIPVGSGLREILGAVHKNNNIFMKIAENNGPVPLLMSDPDTLLRLYKNDKSVKVGSVPLIFFNRYGNGKCIVTASSFLFSDHSDYGICAYDHARLFGNIIRFLAE